MRERCNKTCLMPPLISVCPTLLSSLSPLESSYSSLHNGLLRIHKSQEFGFSSPNFFKWILNSNFFNVKMY